MYILYLSTFFIFTLNYIYTFVLFAFHMILLQVIVITVFLYKKINKIVIYFINLRFNYICIHI